MSFLKVPPPSGFLSSRFALFFPPGTHEIAGSYRRSKLIGFSSSPFDFFVFVGSAIPVERRSRR